MKRTMVIAFVSVFLIFRVGFGSEIPELKNENDKVNYSLGYQIGGDFKHQGVEVNPELIVKGIQDALAESEPMMTLEEMRTTLVDLKKRITTAERKGLKKAAEKNLKEGKEFLAENADKEGVKMLPSGLQYRVLIEGSGATPKPEDTVTVHYRGTLIDGTEFDSSHSRGKPATFRADRVIAAWKEALEMMKEGAKWQLFVPPNLGYGERSTDSIPPNSTLFFEVELISVNPPE